MFNEKTDNLTFYSQRSFVHFSEYIWILSDLFFDFRFLFVEKTMKSHELWIWFNKKITHYTQEVSG